MMNGMNNILGCSDIMFNTKYRFVLITITTDLPQKYWKFKIIHLLENGE